MTTSTVTVKTSASRTQLQPVGVAANWFTLLKAGAVDDLDSNLTRPDLMTDSDHVLATVEGQGTHLVLRCGYTAGDAYTTEPKVRAFGRDKNGKWFKLQALDGTWEVTMPTPATTTDVSDGTLQYTDPDFKDGTTTFDLMGAEKVLLLVSTASAGGSVRTADIIEGLVI